MDAEPVKKIADTLLNYGRKKPREPEKYSRFNRRMLAVTVDSFLLLFFMPLVNRLAPLRTEALEGYMIEPGAPGATQQLINHIFGNEEFMVSWYTNLMVQMVFWSCYSAIFLHFYSATPGKMLLRMKVVDARTEGPISDKQVLLRSFGYLLSTLPACLGFLWIASNKKHRGLHDYLGGTVVINLPMPWKKSKPATTSPPPDTLPDTLKDPAP